MLRNPAATTLYITSSKIGKILEELQTNPDIAVQMLFSESMKRPMLIPEIVEIDRTNRKLCDCMYVLERLIIIYYDYVLEGSNLKFAIRKHRATITR